MKRQKFIINITDDDGTARQASHPEPSLSFSPEDLDLSREGSMLGRRGRVKYKYIIHAHPSSSYKCIYLFGNRIVPSQIRHGPPGMSAIFK